MGPDSNDAPATERADHRSPLRANRRDFVAVASGIAAAATAGCMGVLDGDGSDGQEDRTQTVPASDRVEEHLQALSVEHKVGQFLQLPVNLYTENAYNERGEVVDSGLDNLTEFPVGSILTDGDGSLVPNTPRGWAEATNRLQETAVEESEPAIPFLYGADAIHGHNNLAPATMFPHSTGMGAAWDPDLVRRVGEHTARACRATGVNWNFDPVADVARDHRWGRYYECYSEDPLLTAALVDGKVRGLQDGPNGTGPDAVAATPKHFLGYSAPRNGLDRNPAEISRRRLLTTHLVPFQAGVDAGAETVMLNSGSVNGVPGHASEELVQGMLRGDLGFDGLVVSDWADLQRLRDIHGVGETLADAVKLGLDAGVDVIMTGYQVNGVAEALYELVDQGQVSEERLDESIRRQLVLKERLGLFDDPYADADTAADAAHEGDRDLAYDAVRKSLTLLENDDALPLSGDEDVLVAGPAADSVRMQMGGWTVGWQGVPEDGEEEPPAVTGVGGIEAVAPAGADVTHVPWDDGSNGAIEEAATAAGDADVAVVFLGEEPYAEGQGDDIEAELPPAQIDLVERVGRTDASVVGVMLAGRPLSIEPIRLDLESFLMAYLPGTEGGSAIADALYGEVDPGGRLPITWPESVGQAPLHYDRLPGNGDDEPRYAFGAGGSYGDPRYDIPELATETIEGPALEETVACSVAVENEGDHRAEDVLVAYGEREYMPGPEILPERTVLDFERVALDPGESATVDLECSVGALAVVGGVHGDGERSVRPGEYTVRAGEWMATLTVE